MSCFCNDVCSVMEVLGHEHNPDQWRLFIDSSKVSLKLVLLQNGNKFSTFLWFIQPKWRKVMETWSYCLERLNMKNLSGSYIVIWMLWHCYSECKFGYTKYCCYLYEWDSRDKKNHCVNKLWPKRTSLTPGEKNVVSPPLVLPEKIYLPSLHIKPAIMKNFEKVWIKQAVDSNMWWTSAEMWVTQKSRRVYL